MSAETATTPLVYRNVAELMDRLGHIPTERVRLDPPPGQATEADLLRMMDIEDRLFELVDGVLVEKTMGYSEGMLAAWIIYLIRDYLQHHKIGIVSGPDGTLKLMEGLVRIPDVSVLRWESLPDRKPPREPIPNLGPDLAVEILSSSNTPAEMERKLKEYFLSGTKLVWYIDPRVRTIAVYSSPDQRTDLDETGILEGGDVLPGFQMPVSRIFSELDQTG